MKTADSASMKKKRFSVAENSAAQLHSTITVKCGSVTVEVDRPSNAEIKRNILAGQKALLRAKDAFLKPGVRIHAEKDVPLFSVDPANPSILVRKLNGKEDRGVLKNGAFEVCR